MAVFYRLSQVTSPKQKGYGKWYPRAVMTNTVDTNALATIMQRNCTVGAKGSGTSAPAPNSLVTVLSEQGLIENPL